MRTTVFNKGNIQTQGEYVLYWMSSARRFRYNAALDEAVKLSVEHQKPLVVIEALRKDYPHACERFHAFVIEGMIEHLRITQHGLVYLPYVEKETNAGKGLLQALASKAVCVVSDEYPVFFLSKAHAAFVKQTKVEIRQVDGNGIFPMRAFDKAHPYAHTFRRAWHRLLPQYFDVFPWEDALRHLPSVDLKTDALNHVLVRWEMLKKDATLEQTLEQLGPFEHATWHLPKRVRDIHGGYMHGRATLDDFLKRKMHRYADERSHPDLDAASGLSPWLHFGHMGVHEIYARVMEQEGWTPAQIQQPLLGRKGYLGLSPGAESFMDELITWREVGFNRAHFEPRYAAYDALPTWSKATLEYHKKDPRQHVYGYEDLLHSKTYDPIWNAAQRELLHTGRMQNYLRMLWGKRILEWSTTPEQAYEMMVLLNDSLALDGRDPNSYTGIGWVCGLFDRTWAPERPVYGTIRYMSSALTPKKLKMKRYLQLHGSGLLLGDHGTF